MENELLTSSVRLIAALVAGGCIGLERTYNGRPAGFRTHTLVCTASSALMLLAVFQWQSVSNAPLETIRVDPTRMAQGIMTGIGFLGAGVIMKERLSVRGLTTAASIWITASIGILIGMGLYITALISVLLCVGTLTTFRYLENTIPNLQYAILDIRFLRREQMHRDELIELIKQHEIKVANCSYHLREQGVYFQYSMTVQTRNINNFDHLSETLNHNDKVNEFKIVPIGN